MEHELTINIAWSETAVEIGISGTPVDLPAETLRAVDQGFAVQVKRELAAVTRDPAFAKATEMEARRTKASETIETSKHRIEEVRAECAQHALDDKKMAHASREIESYEGAIRQAELQIASIDASWSAANAARDEVAGAQAPKIIERWREKARKEAAEATTRFWKECLPYIRELALAQRQLGFLNELHRPDAQRLLHLAAEVAEIKGK